MATTQHLNAPIQWSVSQPKLELANEDTVLVYDGHTWCFSEAEREIRVGACWDMADLPSFSMALLVPRAEISSPVPR